MKSNNENQYQKLESKTKIENGNQDSKSNLKIENENSKWNFDYVIAWLISNHYTIDAINVLIPLLIQTVKSLDEKNSEYKETLRLISKITNDNTIKDIVSDTISGK